MAAYFSFRKLITPYFVRTIYTIGFAALTAAGIGWAVWAGMRLNNKTLPTRQAVYYIAIGVGVVLVGNLVWRMICEFWLLLFNMHGLLASIDKAVRQPEPLNEVTKAEPRAAAVATTVPTAVATEREAVSIAPSRSVLGLSS